MSRPHEDLLRKVMLYVSEIGGLPVRVDTPGLLFDAQGEKVKIGRKGQWDSCHCIKGRFVAVEIKIGHDGLKREQANFGKAVERAGGVAIVARSLDDVANRLRLEGLAT